MSLLFLEAAALGLLQTVVLGGQRLDLLLQTLDLLIQKVVLLLKFLASLLQEFNLERLALHSSFQNDDRVFFVNEVGLVVLVSRIQDIRLVVFVLRHHFRVLGSNPSGIGREAVMAPEVSYNRRTSHCETTLGAPEVLAFLLSLLFGLVVFLSDFRRLLDDLLLLCLVVFLSDFRRLLDDLFLLCLVFFLSSFRRLHHSFGLLLSLDLLQFLLRDVLSLLLFVGFRFLGSRFFIFLFDP